VAKLQAVTEAVTDKEVAALTQKDKTLADIVERWGAPPQWRREPGFATLVHIILEQQVSLASAQAASERLVDIASPLTPKTFLELSDEALKGAGFSRQKTRYGRTLATALVEGNLDLDKLETLEDNAAKTQLTQVKGIGNWTADIYLMMALGRPDIWPKGDLALAVAAKELNGLEKRPTQDELESLAEKWRPYRSSAARLLWHYYLSR